jgi:hypothetical protein
MALTGCEVPGAAVYAGGTTVSTDFALSYGNGYSGPGYYYGPLGLSYYRSGPGVYFYRTRQVVPSHYWARWHGDRRYYGGPARSWGDSDHDGVPNRWDRRPGNPYRR